MVHQFRRAFLSVKVRDPLADSTSADVVLGHCAAQRSVAPARQEDRGVDDVADPGASRQGRDHMHATVADALCQSGAIVPGFWPQRCNFVRVHGDSLIGVAHREF